MKKIFLTLFTILFVFTLTACSSKQTEEKVIKMGFVPLNNNETLIEDVQPIADILSEKLGIKVEAFTASNYIGVVEGIGSGSVDFGFMPPFAYLLAKEQSNASSILTANTTSGIPGYYASLFVKNDSGISSLSDLKGKKIAFVDPTSTSGYIYPAAMLVGEGLSLETDVTQIFTGGHEKSLQALMNGDVDAVGSFERLLTRYEKDFPTAKEEVRELQKSDMIPGITIVASSNMDSDMQKKLKEALKEISKDEKTMELFAKLFNITGFSEVDEDAYKKVEETAKIMNVDLAKAK